MDDFEDFDDQSALTPLTTLSHITHSIHMPGIPNKSAMPCLVIGIEQVKASESGSVIRLRGNLNKTNWIIWQAKIKTALETCSMLDYIMGTIGHPNIDIDYHS
jgi:hypothetical protein